MSKREAEIFLMLIICSYLAILVIIAVGAVVLSVFKLFVLSAAARPVILGIELGLVTLFFIAKRIARHEKR